MFLLNHEYLHDSKGIVKILLKINAFHAIILIFYPIWTNHSDKKKKKKGRGLFEMYGREEEENSFKHSIKHLTEKEKQLTQEKEKGKIEINIFSDFPTRYENPHVWTSENFYHTNEPLTFDSIWLVFGQKCPLIPWIRGIHWNKGFYEFAVYLANSQVFYFDSILIYGERKKISNVIFLCKGHSKYSQYRGAAAIVKYNEENFSQLTHGHEQLASLRTLLELQDTTLGPLCRP